MCKNLTVGTTKAYLSSLKLAHELKNLQCENFSSDRIIKLLYSGAKNVKDKAVTISDTRRAMNLSTLLLIGHRIAGTTWGRLSKQVVWATCTLAFFTSVRMGEILASHENSCDLQSTFTWKNVVFTESKEILIRLPYTKTTKFKGSYIDVFSFPQYPCCPVSALITLKNLSIAEGIYDLNGPVFTFASGKFLTTRKLNSVLRDLLCDIYKPEVSCITSHSFRAAIPSAIGAYPDKMLVSDVKDWGNWEGDSYKVYMRLRKSQRKQLFRKVSFILTKSM
jgi:hypothetical protein